MPSNATAPLASELSLPSDQEIRIDRAFKAPRELVWRAFTDAKLFPRWMGPAQYKMTTSEMDLRVGGRYRWVWDLGGEDLVIQGRFLKVDPPKVVVTEETMGPDLNGPATHNTMTFTERHGWTTVSILIKVPDKKMRDAMLATGMKDGMDAGYVRLDGLLEELK